MFQIVTDSTADLLDSFYKENDIVVNQLLTHLDGETYGQDKVLDLKHFYTRVREGSISTTSQVNPDVAKAGILQAAEKGNEILYIAFSSQLSGSCQSAIIAADELKDERPDLKIRVVDSLSASLAEGCLVYEAVQLRKANWSLDAVADRITELSTHVYHILTVDDLKFLQRGGRLSKSSAILGSVLQVKPLIHCTRDGKLKAFGKVRGRQKSIAAVLDLMEEALGANINNKNLFVGIAHGDCEEEALEAERIIHEKYGLTNTMVNYLGPVTGTHAGPGTVAVFFIGENERPE